MSLVACIMLRDGDSQCFGFGAFQLDIYTRNYISLKAALGVNNETDIRQTKQTHDTF